MKLNMRLFVCAALMCVAAIAFAVGFEVSAASDLSPKVARKLIAKLAGIDLPSDAVRVKEVSVTGESAVVVAQVETAFRLEKKNDQWNVAEIRTGSNKWENIDMLVSALNAEKASLARTQLDAIAAALESFHRDRGGFVESKSEAALIDVLNPKYLARIIRVDPWHQPYQYEGTRDSYMLRSLGPDGKPGTPDDISMSK